MSLQLTNKAGAGLIFGAALTASRVFVPSVITSQMKLQDFHMMAAFLAASASSALIIATLDHLSIAKRQPRPNSSNNWFSVYDANIVGGAMIGIGMATTGACPGTVLVQVATGIKSGAYVALGGLLGGILYARFGNLLKKPTDSNTPTPERQHTVDAKYQLKPNRVLLAYEILCLAIISASAAFGGIDAKSPYLHPVLGGSLIGLAQGTSLLLTGSSVGVSTAYAEAGEYFWRFFSSKKAEGQRPKVSAMTFAVGILAGGFAMAQYFPMEVKSADISPLRAVLGGCTMIVGARLAGGCTSGHGISGMASLSVSSMITVAAMFGCGIATATMLG